MLHTVKDANVLNTFYLHPSRSLSVIGLRDIHPSYFHTESSFSRQRPSAANEDVHMSLSLYPATR